MSVLPFGNRCTSPSVPLEYSEVYDQTTVASGSVSSSSSTGDCAAALPFVDHFASGHSLEALDDVIRAISVTSRALR